MIFVQGVDVKYYLDPTIEGDDYHIHFEDDVPHIIIKKFPNTTLASARKRATNLLGKMGKLSLDYPRLTGRSSYEFDFELLQPVSNLMNFKAVVRRPGSDSTILGWEMDFYTEDVLAVFTKNGDYDKMLPIFLLGVPHYQEKASYFRTKLREKILKQFSMHEDLDPAEIPNLLKQYSEFTRLHK